MGGCSEDGAVHACVISAGPPCHMGTVRIYKNDSPYRENIPRFKLFLRPESMEGFLALLQKLLQHVRDPWESCLIRPTGTADR
jgi:hypothetical protein